MHISDQVAELLQNDGWQETAPNTWRCMISGFAPAGTISDGTRIVRLTICDAGRYLSRVDGWNHVEKDVDLRNWQDNPAGAIAAVLEG